MTRFYVGAGSLRILKSNNDDPASTPSTAYGKFNFDSKVADLGYATKSYIVSGSLNGYVPSGSSYGSAYAYRGAQQGTGTGELFQFFPQHLYSYGYIPYVDIHFKNPSTGRYKFYHGFERDGPSSSQIFYNEMAGNILTAADRSYTTPVNGVARYEYIVNDSDNIGDIKCFTWNFPADQTSWNPPTATPQSGQKNVLISGSSVKISRPGFDVATATGRQLIADSNNIPAKIVRAGTVAQIAAGGHVDISLNGLVVPANTFVDGQFSNYGYGDITIPGYKDFGGAFVSSIVQAEYEFVSGGTVLRIWNTSPFAIKGSFIVMAAGDGQTTGTCPVLRRVSGSPDYVQLVRPGCANPAHWDDIIADSRLPYVPLLRQGWVPKSAFSNTSGTEEDIYGGSQYNITLADLPTGYVPFVKGMRYVSRTYDSGTVVDQYFKPCFSRVTNGSQSKRGTGNGPIRISGNVVTFYASSVGWSDYTSENTVEWQGWRYYIFAVPNSF